MINRITKIVKCYGMETNVENTKEIRISRSQSPAQIIIYQKQQNVECFNYLGSMITNEAKSMCDIKPGIGMAKAAFIKKNLYQNMGLKFNEESSKVLHLEHSFVQC
jgi:hypothetical protein